MTPPSSPPLPIHEKKVDGKENSLFKSASLEVTLLLLPTTIARYYYYYYYYYYYGKPTTRRYIYNPPPPEPPLLPPPTPERKIFQLGMKQFRYSIATVRQSCRLQFCCLGRVHVLVCIGICAVASTMVLLPSKRVTDFSFLVSHGLAVVNWPIRHAEWREKRKISSL